MAQSMLVESQIEDGRVLIEHLLRLPFPIFTGWWAKVILDDDSMGDQAQWQFFLASSLVDEQGPAVAYEKAYYALRSMPQFDRISLGIKIIGERNPITQAVFKIVNRFQGIAPICVRRCRLGQIEAEEVYIYTVTLPNWQKVVLKKDVGQESLFPKQGQAMNPIPAGTVINAQVLGATAEPNPLMEFLTIDGKRGGTVYKDDTEPLQDSATSVLKMN